MLLSLACLAGVTYYVLQAGPQIPASIQSPVTPTIGKESVNIVRPKADGVNVKFGSSRTEAPVGTDPKVFAINSLLEQIASVPKDARATSVEIKDGIATVEMASAFARSYGTMDEKTILDGLSLALGQFTEVQSYRLVVAGKPIESIGNVDLKDPIPVQRTGAPNDKP